jgi:hypothetical protein
MPNLAFFMFGVAVDLLWTYLVVAIDRGQPLRAALAQIAFTVVAVGATVLCVEARSLPALLAYASGGGLGTYLAVQVGRKRSSTV